MRTNRLMGMVRCGGSSGLLTKLAWVGVGVAVLLSSAVHAATESVGINVVGSSVANGTLNADYVAGYVPQSNWNNIHSNVKGASMAAGTIIDSNGDAVPAMTLSAPNVMDAMSASTAANESQLTDGRLFEGFFEDNDNTGSYITWLTLTDIPYSEYHVYVYANSENNGQASVRINGGGTEYFLREDSNPLFSGYTVCTDTVGPASSAAICNTIAFSNVTASTLTVEIARYNARIGVSGYQIVNAVTGPINLSGLSASSIMTNSASLSAELELADGTVTAYWDAGAVGDPATHTGWDGMDGPGAETIGTVVRAASGLTADTLYSYAFFATNSAISASVWSSVETFATALTDAQKPSFTAAVATPGSVQLDWNDLAATETGYVLQRSTSELSGYATVAVLPADTTSYTDTAVAPQQLYYYQLAATNSVNASGTDPTLCRTSATTGVAVTDADKPVFTGAVSDSPVSIVLDWQDNALYETGYVLQRSTSELSGYATVVILAADTVTYTDSGLTSDTTYYYQLAATNSLDETSSDASLCRINATTVVGVTDADKPVFTGAVADSPVSIVLDWQDNALYETGYVLQRSTSQLSGYTTVAVLPADTVTYTDGGLAPTSTYYYQLAATNSLDETSSDASLCRTNATTTAIPSERLGSKVTPDSPLIPAGSGLGLGDSFHLVFVTSTRVNMSALESTYGAPRTMATFNSYVNDIADTSTLPGLSNINWYVIGSTSDVDAKDNVFIIAPVYRVGDGAKVADHGADMWDGSTDNRITYDESGNDLSGVGNWQVWSGTATDGTEKDGNRGLDLSSTRYAAGWGNFNPTDGVDNPTWIDLAYIDTGDTRIYRFYACSERLTIASATPAGTVIMVR